MDERPLTPEQQAAVPYVASALDNSGKKNEAIAEEIGVTTNMVAQWRYGKRPVSAKRALALARATQSDPAKLSPAWRDAVGLDDPETSIPDRLRYLVAGLPEHQQRAALRIVEAFAAAQADEHPVTQTIPLGPERGGRASPSGDRSTSRRSGER